MIEYTLPEAAFLRTAIDLAFQAHQTQQRIGGLTYFVHPAEVVNILQAHGITDVNVLAAAWCHDVLEDTDWDPSRIGDTLNAQVQAWVEQLTHRPNQSDNAYWAQIQQSILAVRCIKLADRASNLSSILDKGATQASAYIHHTIRHLNLWNLPNDSVERALYALVWRRLDEGARGIHESNASDSAPPPE